MALLQGNLPPYSLTTGGFTDPYHVTLHTVWTPKVDLGSLTHSTVIVGFVCLSHIMSLFSTCRPYRDR